MPRTKSAVNNEEQAMMTDLETFSDYQPDSEREDTIEDNAYEIVAPEDPKEAEPEQASLPEPGNGVRKVPKEEPETSARPDQGQPARRTQAPILTIDSYGGIETRESREDAAWHEIRNAYRTKKILTGTLGGVERLDNGKTVTVVYYNEFRVIIPISEMMIQLVEDETNRYGELQERQNKILANMLGAEIDFIVKGIDSKTRSVVASRRDAMLKKRLTFYMNPNNNKKINEGNIVQARVIAVAQKVVRVEVFGAECSILAKDLSWDWIGDAHERFNVGDQILVKIKKITGETPESVAIEADVKSATPDLSRENLKKCRIQGKYAGKVTDIHKGVVYVRLAIGVNAIAHSCYDSRMPAKKDDVSFAVTHINDEKNIAVGIITRIIKQAL